MVLRLEGFVEIPKHRGRAASITPPSIASFGGYTSPTPRTTPLDVIDLDELPYGDSIDGLTGVAGALVADTCDLHIQPRRGHRGPLRRAEAALSGVASGVSAIVLLALSDKGASSFDHERAAKLAALGAPAFARTPDQFPGLVATAIERRDVGRWAADEGIALERPKEGEGKATSGLT